MIRSPMISESELLAVIERLDRVVLREWIELGIVEPQRGESGYLFEAVDVARVHLACDLCYDMGLGQESLPVVLSLIDQLHRTRHSLRAFAAAVAEQPDEVRLTITAHVTRTLSGGRDRDE